MMQTNISKMAEGAIVRAVFNATKLRLDHSFKDFLMLELLRDEDSLAQRILTEHLKEWELFQVQLGIENRIHATMSNAGVSPAEFYGNFADELNRNADTELHISTAHILQAIVADRATATSRVLEMYGITASAVAQAIEQFTEEEIISVEIELQHLPKPHTRGNEPRTETETAQLQLEKFGVELTALAEGRFDPVVGREKELDRMIQILSRRNKNNPVLIGEAGVGKSAMVEGLALRIARDEVPNNLRGHKILSLDISSVVAGTRFRGEFEERMQQLLAALKQAKDTILFIDEIQAIAGAGSTQGSLDMANILKPALARGELQIIGATTLDAYRKDIERDPALERRFQPILVEPATVAQSLQILRTIVPRYIKHHNVQYTDEALQACVELSERYITDRALPDKAIDVMDEAGSFAQLQSLAALGDETSQTVTEDIVRRVITTMTGIPAERVSQSESARLQNLQQYLSERVIGQNEAVEKVARVIRSSRAGLRDANRPIGVFLFVGPTGVGKTLLAKELSNRLFDDKRGLIRLDMSEYGEKHTVSRLVGSPPGYVGYGEGGQLTEAVRRQPYSIVLLDEIEKAHPEVFNTMLQIFDEGRLTDGQGRTVDFRNTIIIMTSNAGSQAAVQAVSQVGYNTAAKEVCLTMAPEAAYRKALEQRFLPEFLNRIDEIIIFHSLDLKDMERIVDLELNGLFGRVEKQGYHVRITQTAKRRLAERGYEPRYGARALKRMVADAVEMPLTSLILSGELHDGDTIVIETDRAKGFRLRVAVA